MAISKSDYEKSLHPQIEDNIRALRERKGREEQSLTFEDRVTAAIVSVAGSIGFVVTHFALVAGWVVSNFGLIKGVRPWDPTFADLSAIASVECLFLTLFILINQKRMTLAATKNADLDLHISLLTEHEVTQLITLVSAIAGHLDVKTAIDHHIETSKSDVAPEVVLDKLDEATQPNKAETAVVPRSGAVNP